MSRAALQCAHCQITQAGRDWFIEFHVHHKEYVKGWEPWEYPDDYLELLCWQCHEQHHYIQKIKESGMWDVLMKVLARRHYRRVYKQPCNYAKR